MVWWVDEVKTKAQAKRAWTNRAAPVPGQPNGNAQFCALPELSSEWFASVSGPSATHVRLGNAALPRLDFLLGSHSTSKQKYNF